MAPSREWRPGRVSTRNGGVASRPARSCYAPPPMVSAPMLPASLAAGLESRRFVAATLGAALVLRLF